MLSAASLRPCSAFSISATRRTNIDDLAFSWRGYLLLMEQKVLFLGAENHCFDRINTGYFVPPGRLMPACDY